MKKLLNFFFVFVFCLGIFSNTASAASLTKYLGKHGPDEYAIIYGCIDTSSSKTNIKGVAMLHYPARKKIYMGRVPTDVESYLNQKDGYFWAIAKPGKYYFTEFVTRDGTIHSMHPKNKDEINAQLMVVDKGDLFYWGSTKYIKMKKNQFALQPVDSPGEKEILEDLLQYAKGTKWENVITHRLKSM